MKGQLPLELFDTIVGCLHRDFTTLQSVSTVSSTFRSLAQRKIFYEVSLSIPSGIEQPNFGSAEVLLEHLAESPHLLDYVRRLNITDDGYTRQMNAFTMQGDDAFIHILSSFKHLSAIIFRRRVSKIKWANLPSNMQTAILESIRCPTVVRVEILDTIADFHLQLLVDSHALKHLRVFDLEAWERVLPFKPSPPVQKMALKSLELRETTPLSGGKVFRFTRDPESVDLSQLTSLRVEMDRTWPSLIKETEAFLRKVAGSLKCLHYFRPRHARRHDFDSSTLDLSIPSYLECLRISTNLADNGFPWLIKCLGRIPPCSRINTIKLHLNLDMHVPSYPGDIDWGVLDTLICALPNLRSCHIYIRTTTRSILRMLGGLLPCAQSKGILRVTIWFCTATQQSLFF
ncbi:uncharacterized protein LACBIDRAFT_316158 [Laccaria bicolor S238N-H82]|uniref:Predicted protein n=1 Tax=Laccaria bicolor (strain S238N-H82 / ATCC MYA-4686) TaxID=486041 RepID=B0DS62_LACBS|nr:uncharacterized protein LACBIDRAFT_332271 [Laccaria bicolor S238N-H82]XP_001889628.1 uncharacterized protein LACBIDRAFT_316158 [Laccaria bicolor S238N-H82]EDQ99651.1 predicted protein [Laccaria bicolor S238N-H82]EDR02493.1 predicted protein [Laccaria bicolor S238N-H82]|eukprot:XP_001886856.1 predicted protein [Laccaria bicolor S238N-H82]